MLPKGLLKEYSRTLSMTIRLIDMLGIVMAGVAAYFLRFQHVSIPAHYLAAIFIGAILATIVFGFCNLYTSLRAAGWRQHFVALLQALFALTIAMAGLAFFTKAGESYSRIWFGLWMINSFVFLLFYRYIVFLFLRFMRAKGWNERRVVIIVADELGV